MGHACSRRASNPATLTERIIAQRRQAAKQTFITAVRRVIHLLRLRRKWAAYGRILQEAPRCFLWSGLERRAGKLVRLRPASDHLRSVVLKAQAREKKELRPGTPARIPKFDRHHK